MDQNSKIYIAGHLGMVGSAIHRRLLNKGYKNFVLRTIDELDLIRQSDVEAFFEKERPEYVIDAAAKVGGILANDTYRAQFIYENLMIQNNIIHSSYQYGVKKLLFLGSSCIYPKNAPQPLKEEYLLTGLLEPTNEPYAIAKIAGIKMCENYYRQYGSNFISVMPTNLYGPNDNYNLETSHVLPALIRKMHLGKCLENNDWQGLRNDLQKRPIEEIDGNASDEAILSILSKYGITINSQIRQLTNSPISDSPQHYVTTSRVTRHASRVTITLWGTGKVYREFMHVDDMAAACVFVMENIDAGDLYSTDQDTSRVTRHASRVTFLNIGTGEDLTILETGALIKDIVGFRGIISWDHSKPDGTPKKMLDIGKLKKLGFDKKLSLQLGIEMIYKDYSIQEPVRLK